MNEINLIRKIAWSFHHATGIELDELFSEACLAYCQALKSYDPKRGRITTYVWYCIHSHMKNYLDKFHRRQPKLLSFEDLKFDKEQSVEQLFESLSPEASEIARMILRMPKKFAVMKPGDARQRVIHIMKKQGWAWDRIAVGMHDLKLAFSD